MSSNLSIGKKPTVVDARRNLRPTFCVRKVKYAAVGNKKPVINVDHQYVIRVYKNYNRVADQTSSAVDLETALKKMLEYMADDTWSKLNLIDTKQRVLIIGWVRGLNGKPTTEFQRGAKPY